MCVCMYVFMYVYECIYTHTQTPTHPHTHTHTHYMDVYTHTRARARTHTHTLHDAGFLRAYWRDRYRKECDLYIFVFYIYMTQGSDALSGGSVTEGNVVAAGDKSPG